MVNSLIATVLRISGSSETSNISDDGFSIKYMGARSDNRLLSIFSDDQDETQQVEAVNILQNGNIGFGVVQTDGSVAEHAIPSSGGGVITAGKIKAREFEVTGNITVQNVTELTGLSFINLGDTPAGYNAGDARFVKVNTDADGLLFQNIGTGDVSGFDLAVNALIENNTNISYSNIDGRPTDIGDLTDNGSLIPDDIGDLLIMVSLLLMILVTLLIMVHLFHQILVILLILVLIPAS